MEYYEHKLDPVGQRPDWLSDEDRIDYLSFGVDWWDEEFTCNPGCIEVDHAHTIRIPADHWAVPALKAGKVPVREPEGLTPGMVEKLISHLNGWRVQEPDGDGDVWLVFRPHTTSGTGMVNLGKADRIVSQVAMIADEDRRALITELQSLNPDPIKAALQDKWPALDTDALRETLAKHNLKIVEA